MLDYPAFIRECQKYGFENTLQLFYGIYHAICTDNNDPDKQGRIKLKVPVISDTQVIDTWAYPIQVAGNNAGFFAVPSVGDGVWVCFENGNPRFPSYLGGWWAKPNGKNEAPDEVTGDDYPNVSIIKTSAGHYLLFNNRKNIVRLENKNGGFVEIADNIVKLYGEAEPAVLGDKNQAVHQDHIAELQAAVTELQTTIVALLTAFAAFAAVAPTLAPAVTAFTTAIATVQTSLTGITSRLTLLDARIPQTKSTKVKLS